MLSNFNRKAVIASLLGMLIFSSGTYSAEPVVGNTYFTKHNLKYEKGRHITTNYWRGDFLPVNSQVQVKSIKGNRMVLGYNGQDITIENVEKYTKKSVQEVADRMLSISQVNTGGPFANDIKFGEVRLGMTKDQVIMTRGYPPEHKTMSTEMDTWVYWSSRFVQISYVFENGKLARGRGLR